MIRPIHPFPARMAPGLAIEKLQSVPRGSFVLDPMAGSGTVLRQATELGYQALGFDTDPLAVLMAKVWTRPVDETEVDRLSEQVTAEAKRADAAEPLHWIDDDPETTAFVEYWFAEPQRSDLRRLAGALAKLGAKRTTTARQAAADVLRLALSRVIITKDQGISLARDTSHSRPHKVADASSASVFPTFERSIRQLLQLLGSLPPKGGCEVRLGDARALCSVGNRTIDIILTSPPYLNAIDYMRGHRLSLVWLGYRLADLRTIRAESIGAERGVDEPRAAGLFDAMLEAMGRVEKLSGRHRGMVARYCEDVYRLMSEMARVLKPDGKAILIVGNSCLRGQFISNSEGVTHAGRMVGLRLQDQVERDLPQRNRYLPMPSGGEGPLGKRMRTETILTFSPT